MLELAILGLLHESPMHGYELRKRLLALLGAIRAAFSYGSLYPTLKRMRQRGLIIEEAPVEGTAEKGAAVKGGTEKPLLTGRRARKVYRLTPEGKEHFAQLMAEAGPETADEALFGVHFAFFSRTDPATRLRILEARRRRVEERRERIREALCAHRRAARRLRARAPAARPGDRRTGSALAQRAHRHRGEPPPAQQRNDFGEPFAEPGTAPGRPG